MSNIRTLDTYQRWALAAFSTVFQKEAGKDLRTIGPVGDRFFSQPNSTEAFVDLVTSLRKDGLPTYPLREIRWARDVFFSTWRFGATRHDKPYGDLQKGYNLYLLKRLRRGLMEGGALLLVDPNTDLESLCNYFQQKTPIIKLGIVNLLYSQSHGPIDLDRFRQGPTAYSPTAIGFAEFLRDYALVFGQWSTADTNNLINTNAIATTNGWSPLPIPWDHLLYLHTCTDFSYLHGVDGFLLFAGSHFPQNPQKAVEVAQALIGPAFNQLGWGNSEVQSLMLQDMTSHTNPHSLDLYAETEDVSDKKEEDCYKALYEDRYAEATILFLQYREQALSSGDFLNAGEFSYYLSDAFVGLDQLDEAIEAKLFAAQCFQRTGMTSLAIEAIIKGIGLLCETAERSRAEDLNKALAYLLKAESLAIAHQQSKVLLNIGHDIDLILGKGTTSGPNPNQEDLRYGLFVPPPSQEIGQAFELYRDF